MNDTLDPKSLGLPPRTIVEKINEDTLAIVIRRKSRIIMTDGKKILDKISQITLARPTMHVVLKTTAPICSKTMEYFKNKGLKVIKE